MLTFEEAMDATAGSKRSLLLGNGFSIAYDGDFHYDSLWAKALGGGVLPSEAVAIAEELETRNFEDVLRFYARLEFGAAQYGLLDASGRKRLEADVDAIRAGLVAAISRVHLEPRLEMDADSVLPAFLFFARFQDIFTLNYDLLLYWAWLKAIDLEDQDGNPILDKRLLDGFARPEGDRLHFVEKVLHDAEEGLHYVHGALHLFHDGGTVYKLKAGNGKTLKAKIIESIRAGRLPVVVTEGSPRSKMEKIMASPYLRHVHQKLGAVHGELFSFGLSFSDQDAHVRSAIAANPRLSRIFVGVRPRAGEVPTEMRERCDRMAAERETYRLLDPGMPALAVEYYDAASAKPWNW